MGTAKAAETSQFVLPDHVLEKLSEPRLVDMSNLYKGMIEVWSHEFSDETTKKWPPIEGEDYTTFVLSDELELKKFWTEAGFDAYLGDPIDQWSGKGGFIYSTSGMAVEARQRMDELKCNSLRKSENQVADENTPQSFTALNCEQTPCCPPQEKTSKENNSLTFESALKLANGLEAQIESIGGDLGNSLSKLFYLISSGKKLRDAMNRHRLARLATELEWYESSREADLQRFVEVQTEVIQRYPKFTSATVIAAKEGAEDCSKSCEEKLDENVAGEVRLFLTNLLDEMKRSPRNLLRCCWYIKYFLGEAGIEERAADTEEAKNHEVSQPLNENEHYTSQLTDDKANLELKKEMSLRIRTLLSVLDEPRRFTEMFGCLTASKNSEQTTKNSSLSLREQKLRVDSTSLRVLRNVLRHTLQKWDETEGILCSQTKHLWFDSSQNMSRLAASLDLLESPFTYKFGWRAPTSSFAVEMENKSPIRDPVLQNYSYHLYKGISEVVAFALEKQESIAPSSVAPLSKVSVEKALYAAEKWLEKVNEIMFQCFGKKENDDKRSKALSNSFTTSRKLFGRDGKSQCTFRVYVDRFSDSSSVVVRFPKKKLNHNCNVRKCLRAQRIPSRWREFISRRLELGMSVDDILRKVKKRLHGDDFERAEEDQESHRGMLITKADIEAMKKSLGLQDRIHQRDDADMIAFLWEQHVKKRDLFYLALKPYLCGVNHEKAFGIETVKNFLKTEDSFAVMSSPKMLALAKKYGRFIFADATHCLSVKKNIKLVTLLVADDNHHGFPIMFCVTNHETTEIYSAMFQILKERVPGLEVETVLSDMNESPFNGARAHWSGVRWLNCTFHVVKAVSEKIRTTYSRNLSKKEKQKKINFLSTLFRNLVYKQDAGKFTQDKAQFIRILKAERQTDLLAYFHKEYFTPEKELCWALCHRNGPSARLADSTQARTNNFVESFHSVLKSYHFKRPIRLADLFRRLKDVEEQFSQLECAVENGFARGSLLNFLKAELKRTHERFEDIDPPEIAEDTSDEGSDIPRDSGEELNFSECQTSASMEGDSDREDVSKIDLAGSESEALANSKKMQPQVNGKFEEYHSRILIALPLIRLAHTQGAQIKKAEIVARTQKMMEIAEAVVEDISQMPLRIEDEIPCLEEDDESEKARSRQGRRNRSKDAKEATRRRKRKAERALSFTCPELERNKRKRRYDQDAVELGDKGGFLKESSVLEQTGAYNLDTDQPNEKNPSKTGLLESIRQVLGSCEGKSFFFSNDVELKVQDLDNLYPATTVPSTILDCYLRCLRAKNHMKFKIESCTYWSTLFNSSGEVNDPAPVQVSLSMGRLQSIQAREPQLKLIPIMITRERETVAAESQNHWALLMWDSASNEVLGIDPLGSNLKDEFNLLEKYGIRATKQTLVFSPQRRPQKDGDIANSAVWVALITAKLVEAEVTTLDIAESIALSTLTNNVESFRLTMLKSLVENGSQAGSKEPKVQEIFRVLNFHQKLTVQGMQEFISTVMKRTVLKGSNRSHCLTEICSWWDHENFQL